MSHLAPQATYKTFRVIAENGTFRPSNFLKAMQAIVEGNIDVVNLSAGKFHPNCNGECRICMAVEDVTNSGTIVVPGAGNKTRDKNRSVFCPAKSAETIAVGASETLCTASPEGDTSTLIQGPSGRPPGSYWVKRDDPPPFYPDQNYCGHGGCSPFHDCENNQKTIYWNGNVEWKDYLPEVVAPGHIFLESETTGQTTLEPGTSYSCAVVSGGIATVMSDLLPKSPSPHQIRRAVEATSSELDCGMVGKFNMGELRKALESVS